MLRKILPDSIITVMATPDMWDTPAYPEELVLVSKAIEKRKKEFYAGRNCAREALRQLGVIDFPILSHNRAPIWPQNITGSISHTKGCCGAAVTEKRNFRSIGIDIEKSDPLEGNIIDHILTKKEKNHYSSQSLGQIAKLIFSIKESFYKAHHPLGQQFLSFEDAFVELDFSQSSYVATLLCPPPKTLPEIKSISGKFAEDKNFIYTTALIP